MKDGKLLIIAVVLMLAMMFVMTYQNKMLNDYKHQLELVDTTKIHDTIYQTITLTDSVPKYIKKTITKTDTIYSITGDTLNVNLITKDYSNTFINDNDTITYNATITGRNYEGEQYPILDSISFKYNKQIINTTTIIEKPIQYNKKWKLIVTPTISTGYDPINKQFGTLIGIGVGITKK